MAFKEMFRQQNFGIVYNVKKMFRYQNFGIVYNAEIKRTLSKRILFASKVIIS